MVDDEHLGTLLYWLGGVHLECVGLLVVEDFEVLLGIIDLVCDFVVQLLDELHGELRPQQLNPVEVVEFFNGWWEVLHHRFCTLLFRQHFNFYGV